MNLYFFKSKIKFLFLSFFSIVFFTVLIPYILEAGLDGDDNYKYLHWSNNLFSDNYYTILFRPFFYLYGKLSLIIFDDADYSIKVSNLLLYILNFILIFKLAMDQSKNFLISIIISLMCLFNPFLIGAIFNEETTIISITLILLNSLIIFKIISNYENEKKFESYFIFLGILGCLLLLTHEELVMIFVLDVIFIYFYFKNKFRKNLVISVVSFILTFSIFYYLFANEEFLKHTISLILNVIHRDLNFFIRETVIEKQVSTEYFNRNYIEFFVNQISWILSRTYWTNSFFTALFFITCFFYYLTKKKFLFEKFLVIQILIYIIFLMFIRVADRLFLVYLPLLYLTILIFFIHAKEHKHFKILLIILIISFFPFVQKLDKIKGVYSTMLYKSEPRYIYDHLKNEVDKDNKILMLSSFEDRMPIKSFSENVFSENYNLASFLYFDTNALILKQVYNLRNINYDFKKFLRDEKIGYIILRNQNDRKYSLDKKNVSNLKKLFSENKIDEIIKKNVEETNKFKKENYYLKLYNVDLDKMVLIDAKQENNLVLDEIRPFIKDTIYFSDKKFMKTKPKKKSYLQIIYLSFSS